MDDSTVSKFSRGKMMKSQIPTASREGRANADRGKLKAALTLVVLTVLVLTGCSGKHAAGEPAGVETVTVPDVVNLTLDKAMDELKDLGLKVEAADTVDGKSIILKKNWQVTSQDPVEGAQLTKGSTVHLGVKHKDKEAAEKAAADKAAAEKAAADKAAAEKAAVAKVAAAKLAAEKAAAAKRAAEKAAADRAAAQLAAEQAAAAKATPAVPAAPPAAVYYKNCTEARAAGAAPVYEGTPGYGKHLDRDGDGIGCDK
ncbi:excalibur calcium-binding domain-containing protein [Arthrobacter silvisoli]|uniref:excalibur calcium-binding domain-containing protein n=1 Tax=Arthrobacter silvisoli TaxID=2291022 RepID=UPI001FED1ECA|nr:excalibur calcium-binding domain-containing protein [Arthrobacter silvisoli]